MNSLIVERMKEVLHVVTIGTVMEEMVKDPRNVQQMRGMMPSEMFTVRHDLGQFNLSYDEIKDLLAVFRMRGLL